MKSLTQKIILPILILLLNCPVVNSQNQDSVMLRKIYSEILVNGKAYKWLYDMTTTIGGRLSGSPQAEEAVEFIKKAMKEAGADSVWLQEVYVPHWGRGEKEK